jgi:hypothetical protein
MHVKYRNGLIWLLFAAFLGVQALAGTQTLALADVSEIEFAPGGALDGDDPSADGLAVAGSDCLPYANRICAAQFSIAYAAPVSGTAASFTWATGPPA